MEMTITARRDDLFDAILTAQAEDGAFRSFTRLCGRTIEDRNGFITALVLRTIGHDAVPTRLLEARARALDYLEACESHAAPGAFGFWPESGRPSWAPRLPPDADDTAVMALELHRAGRRPLEWLRRVALTTLLPFRSTGAEQQPGWLRPGVFLTWLARGRPNPVDCVVNVNVAALLAVSGLTHVSAYRAIVSMVAAALEWTCDDVRRAALIAPFYAHPIELYWALVHAVGCGVSELEPSLDRTARWLATDAAYDADRPVCCSAYGAQTWTAPVLQLVRKERALFVRPPGAGRTNEGAHGDVQPRALVIR